MPDDYECSIASYPGNKTVCIKIPTVLHSHFKTQLKYTITLCEPKDSFRNWLICENPTGGSFRVEGRAMSLYRSAISYQPGLGYFGRSPATGHFVEEGFMVVHSGIKVPLAAKQPAGFIKNPPQQVRTPAQIIQEHMEQAKFSLIEPTEAESKAEASERKSDLTRQDLRDLIDRINQVEDETDFRLEFDPLLRRWVFRDSI
jgi:hypothetical protein